MVPTYVRALILVTTGTLVACSSGGAGLPAPGQAGSGGTSGSPGGDAGASGGAGSGGDTAGAGAGGVTPTGGSGGAAGATGGSGGVTATGGSGGVTATGGAGGVTATGGAGGHGGSGGSPTTGGSGGKPTGMSAGCNQPPPNEVSGKWATHDIMVTVDPKFAAQAKRRYFTNPPPKYDPTKPWPLTLWGNGCGTGSTAEGELLMGGPASTSSVQVQLLAFKGCFSAGPDGDNASSPELPYFDVVLAEVEAAYCIDKSKVYVSGYSSGAWFTGLMSCNRANVISGVGFAAGGLQLNHDPCSGQTAAIVVRGTGDGGTPEAQTLAAIDSLVMRNGCTKTTMPWDPGEKLFNSAPCVAYQGCQAGFPVVYCAVPGGHTDGGSITSQGFWKFWTSP
jgi:polyhydroxybutyrate depolymerase